VQLRYHLDLWGGDRAALAAATAAAAAVREEQEAVTLVLSTAVARGYGRLLAALERQHLTGLQVAALGQALGMAAARYQDGVDPLFPTENLKARLAALKGHRAEAEAEERLARNQLATLAGEGPEWGRKISVPSVVSGTASSGAKPLAVPPGLAMPASLPLQRLAGRPDLRAALSRIAAAGHGITVARAAFYPQVDLVGFAGLQRVGLSDLLFTGAARAFSIGPSITLPVFEGGRLKANLSEKEAVYDALVERYNGAVLEAAQAVADLVVRDREAVARQAASADALQARERVASLAGSLETAGLKPAGFAAERRVEALDEQLKQLALRADRWGVAVGLVEALGEHPADAQPAAARGKTTTGKG
jgi:NodT family efflux transporter outer membrane factor (OMF) lipoprotein